MNALHLEFSHSASPSSERASTTESEPVMREGFRVCFGCYFQLGLVSAPGLLSAAP